MPETAPAGIGDMPACGSAAGQVPRTIRGMSQPVIGIDFSSRPSRRKPIVLARGTLRGAVLRLDGLQRFDTLESFGQWLALPGAWVGGFDLPFGLPRELVQTLGWPTDWAASIAHYSALGHIIWGKNRVC